MNSKITKKWMLPGVTLLLAASTILISCTPTTVTSTTTSTSTATTTSTSTTTTTVLSGRITLAGSTTVQPLAEQLRDAFQTKYPGVTVTVSGGGSSVGVKSAQDGTVDIGTASRALKSSEVGTVVDTTIARDGIAVIVNPSLTGITNLTKAQVQDIFSGKITNWKDVGGPDKTIVVVSREEGSGTRAAFQEMLLTEAVQITGSAILQSSNGAIRTTVIGNPYAIAYLSFGYLDSSIKALSLEGIATTVENAKNGTYPAVRPLLFLTKTQPTGLVKAFIDFCLSSEGQAIVSEEYISVN